MNYSEVHPRSTALYCEVSPMTALFALSSSLLWGAADFGGGLLTRRLPALVVVVASQAATPLVPRAASTPARHGCSTPSARA
jgi:hypothetical protein